jgi:hypothetical protein
MTRDDFFDDLNELVRLFGQLGLAQGPKADATQKIATMKAGGLGVRPDDLRRYADAIDWDNQSDVQALRDLARLLIRILAGLATELESFRRAQG